MSGIRGHGAAALALLLAVALAGPASAQSATATAAVVSGGQLLPVGGQRLEVRVTNTAGTLGRAITAVRIAVPTAAAGVGLADPPMPATGWSVSVDRQGPDHAAVFSGGTIAASNSATLPLEVDVTAPQRSDVFGDVRVHVSSDDGATWMQAAAVAPEALRVTVRVLELDVATAGVLAPPGATDGTATAGQTVTVGVRVRNHAVEPLDVTVSLGTSDSRDTTSGPVLHRLDGGAAAWTTFLFSATLGQATTDRTTILLAEIHAADATIPGGWRYVLRVQAPVSLTAKGLSPTHARSGVPITVTVSLGKSGTPALTVSRVTLCLASTCWPADGPIVLAGGSQGFDVRVPGVVLPAAQGPAPVTVTLEGTDENGAALRADLLAGSITIDDTPPSVQITEVRLPADMSGEQQPALKSGDPLTVRCEVGADASRHEVRLEPDEGAPAVFPGACAGSAPLRADYHPDASELYVVVIATDAAGNTGTARYGPIRIDQDAPAVNGKARVTTPTTIRIPFSDPSGVLGGCDPLSWSIDGVPLRVEQVLSADGRPCGAGAAAPATKSESGIRILVLRMPLAPGAAPAVTYRPCPLERVGQRCASDVRDRVGNYTPEVTVQSIAP